jgi:hypothetical protein
VAGARRAGHFSFWRNTHARSGVFSNFFEQVMTLSRAFQKVLETLKQGVGITPPVIRDFLMDPGDCPARQILPLVTARKGTNQVNMKNFTFKLKTYQLRNTEFLQLNTDLLLVVEQNDPEALQVAELYQTMKQQVTEANRMLHQQRGHVLSRRLSELDMQREAALTGLQRTMDGARYSPYEVEREAAEKLQTFMAGFGKGISKNNYASQTTVVRNLLDELQQNSALADAVTTLGLQKWITQLQTVNAQFQAGYVNRSVDRGSHALQPLGLKRMAITEAWERLERRLWSHFDISEGASPWSETLTGINGILTTYQALLDRRQQGFSDEADTVTEENSDSVEE